MWQVIPSESLILWDSYNLKSNDTNLENMYISNIKPQYRGADKSLARPTYRCILFDGENISFDASLVIYIYK
jgi:hypothetical protein